MLQQNRRLIVSYLAASVVAFAGIGCEKQIHEAKTAPDKPATSAVASNAPTTLPSDASATPAAAVIPATTTKAPSTQSQPVLALLTINGLGAEFPPTKVLMHERDRDGKIAIELYSDLPKSALRKYDGNELYLEMKLDADPTDSRSNERAEADWHFKSTSSGRVDSPNGIFLHGQAMHLQPQEVWVKFDREAGQLVARIAGEFRSYESGTPDALAPSVNRRRSSRGFRSLHQSRLRHPEVRRGIFVSSAF